jgi:phosphatidylserine decarboxylase
LKYKVIHDKGFNDNNYIHATADVTIVAMEEIFEAEYLITICIKLSIFMSVFNVHRDIISVSGEIKYYYA